MTPDRPTNTSKATSHAPRRPRGGPRPGSGPPRGNTNALTTGESSKRYGLALRLLAAVPALHERYSRLYAAPGPDARLRQLALLEAARTLIDTDPELTLRLEELIVLHVFDRMHEVPKGRVAIAQLAKPIASEKRLARTILVTTWLAGHDPILERPLTEYLLARLEALTPPANRKNSTKRPNAQSKAASPKPQAPGGRQP